MANKIKRAEALARLAPVILEQAAQKPLTLLDPSQEGTVALMGKVASAVRPAMPGQMGPIEACIRGLRTYGAAILIGEMGVGKTQMSLQAAIIRAQEMGDGGRVVFMTTAKLAKKMAKEAREIWGPLVEVFHISAANRWDKDGTPVKLKKDEILPEDIPSLPRAEDGRVQIFFVSKDAAKIESQMVPKFNWGDRCPGCNERIMTKTARLRAKRMKGNLAWKKALPKRGQPLRCEECQTSLLGPKTANLSYGSLVFPKAFKKHAGDKGFRRQTVSARLKRAARGQKVFDILVVDEVHEMQNPFSNQGKLYRQLAGISREALIMTGTLSNGYPSSIFFILQGVIPQFMKRAGYDFDNLAKFVRVFGATRSVAVTEKRISKGVKTNELPYISEAIVGLLAPFTVWVSMEDLNLPMPSYREIPEVVNPDQDLMLALEDFRQEVVGVIKKVDPNRLHAFGQRFVYLQNNPTFPFTYSFEAEVEEIVGHGEDGMPIYGLVKKEFSFNFKPLPAERLFNKERALVDYLRREKGRGRNVMLYSIYNKAAKVSSRLAEVIARELPELHVEVMPESISGKEIEPWIERHPCDVLIVSPLKVSTGLDLVQFPSIAFYETGANLRLVQQAARRSWRAFGQDKPVEVTFFAYQGLQAALLELLGKKLKGAAAVEGRKVEVGQLAQVYDEDADFTAALKRVAEKIEEEIQPDFSSSEIPEGKMRPNTVYEQAYIDILNEIHPGLYDDRVAIVDQKEDDVDESEEETAEETEEVSEAKQTDDEFAACRIEGERIQLTFDF